MDQQSLARQRQQGPANSIMTKQMNREGNVAMIERIMQMPVAPYEEGKFVYRVVEIHGRKSGKAHQVPLAVFQYDGTLYLIAPGRSRDWAQNLLVANECVLITKMQREHYHTTLTFDPIALLAVRAYIGQLASWASQQFPFSLSDSDEEIQSKAEQFAIFRLTC